MGHGSQTGSTYRDPLSCGQTDTCENITSPQTSFAEGDILSTDLVIKINSNDLKFNFKDVIIFLKGSTIYPSQIYYYFEMTLSSYVLKSDSKDKIRKIELINVYLS